jgi:DNA-binding NarL/FixJ family response regulator
MKPIFVSGAEQARERWRAAFADLQVVASLELARAAGAEPLFLDLDTWSLAQHRIELATTVAEGRHLIALSSVPSESEAFQLLAVGVRGYCHAEAVPEQLREVAQVVLAGGLWMPRELVQRIADLGKRVDDMDSDRTPSHFDILSAREEEVALLVGRGYNNREIAEALSVSERTIKANLTSIFDKLGLRDRVQLALFVNRLPIH